MFKNYFKTAWRNLIKSKTFSFINLFGLTIGITSFILIALYVFDELTFDTFHQETENIYRVIEVKRSPEGKESKIGATGYQVSARAVADLPQVKQVARFANLGRTNVATRDKENVFYENFAIGSPGVLTVFDFKLKYGNKNTALNEPHSVIITEETANKFFGKSEVLGKVLQVDRDDSIPYKITGVLKNFPANSSISFDLLFSESSIMNQSFRSMADANWSSGAFTTYLLLQDKVDPGYIEKALTKLIGVHQAGQISYKSNIVLQNVKDIHFYSADIEEGYSTKGIIKYIWVFSIIALFVLFIACINYVNLTTARFISRTKEIAVGKIAGASRSNLIRQFIAEAFLLTTLALAGAMVFIRILLPSFNNFTHKSLTLGLTTDYRIWLGIVLTLILVSLLSGVYPALFQSRLKPILLLKNKGNRISGNISLRRSLVVFQFVLSVIMIVATIVVYQQMKFISNSNMGFNKKNVVVIDINSGSIRRNAEAIREELTKLPQVKNVTVSSRVPGEWKNLPKIKAVNESKNVLQPQELYFIGADEQFLDTYQLPLIAGSNFSKENTSDSTSVLLNETAAKELGITLPNQQIINISAANLDGDFSPLNEPFLARVIGIVKDFNFQSLHDPLAPMIIAYRNNPVHNIDYFTARVEGEDLSKTIQKMNAVLKSFDAAHLFEYHFLEGQWELFYKADKVQETIFLIMASLAILIACLGLFGLATFSAEQRTKEIGVRKVLGASISGIVSMLSKDYLRLVLVASVIAFPAAWWIMNKWLEGFAYRIQISWGVFILAGFIAVMIALLTVAFQAIKSALASPVVSLRSE